MTLEILTNPAEKVKALKSLLRGPNRETALDQIPSLTIDEKKELFPEWIHLSRAAHSPFQLAWNVIESLPREWVLQNIEKEVDPILRNDEETDYWMFLQLFARLDGGLARTLAQRAAANTDQEIRELGEEFLAKAILEEAVKS